MGEIVTCPSNAQRGGGALSAGEESVHNILEQQTT